METWTDAPEILKSLSESLESYEWTSSSEQCLQLIHRLDAAETAFPEAIAKAILSALRRKRQFVDMELVADALVRNGQTAPFFYRQYAQALIDRGSITAAAITLETILSDTRTSISEKAEANGLLGRIYKQQYVNAGQPDNARQRENLIQAIGRYYDVYKTNPTGFYWHGINTVALLARAAKDRVSTSLPVGSGDIAAQIEGQLAKDTLDQWESATAVETAVALGNFTAAYDRAIVFITNPAVDAFEIGSLLRQLTEVWQLSIDREPGANLLPLLRAALLRHQGGEIKVSPEHVRSDTAGAQQAQSGLERVFGQDRYQPLEWYKTGLKRCTAIGRVETVTGQKIGTGFLVQATDFFPKRAAGELLLLTNAHVISPEDALPPNAIPASAARIQFEALGLACNVTGLVWSSPIAALDSTFVSLENVDSKSEVCPLSPPPAAFNPDGGQRLYVIGYPRGGGLSFSLQDSKWLDQDDKVLHYRTPTEPGSSGSPVFDQDYWTLLALHHKGRTDLPRLNGNPGTYEANEGISIKAIQAETRST